LLAARCETRARSALPPAEEPEYQQSMAAARERLGEERFANAWNEGQAMRPDESVATALEGPDA
jgi:hypothetical protein